jgi:hypothetical protein
MRICVTQLLKNIVLFTLFRSGERKEKAKAKAKKKKEIGERAKERRDEGAICSTQIP